MLAGKDKIKVFVDFDGTITRKDVGASIFLNFGDMQLIEPIVKRIDSGEISGSEGWKELFMLLPHVPKSDLDEFINSVEIDSSFHNFAEFLNANGIEYYVLSDGFDYYIEKIFNRENILGIKYFSNRLFYNAMGEMETEYPYRDEECKECANCKRDHLLMHSADEEYTIYIGNGSSDRCPAQYCDFIFAKDSLLRFCEKERISFSPFDSFNDVQKKMSAIVAKKRLKKRHQAELKRRAAYLQG